MAITTYPDGTVVETDPNWTPGGYVVPASERGAPVAGVNLAPIPNRVPAATLQAAAGRDVPMVRQGGSVIPAPPIYNNGRPTNVAWSIDPVNGSVSPLVGAYSAYPHVVYAPQRIGAGNLLATVLAGLQNNPYIGLAQASVPRQQGGGTGGGTGGGRQPRGQQQIGRGTVTGDMGVRPSTNPNVNPYPDGMVLTTAPAPEPVPEVLALDNAANTDPFLQQRLEENPEATPAERALARNTATLFGGTALMAAMAEYLRNRGVGTPPQEFEAGAARVVPRGPSMIVRQTESTAGTPTVQSPATEDFTMRAGAETQANAEAAARANASRLYGEDMARRMEARRGLPSITRQYAPRAAAPRFGVSPGAMRGVGGTILVDPLLEAATVAVTGKTRQQNEAIELYNSIPANQRLPDGSVLYGDVNGAFWQIFPDGTMLPAQ